MSLKLLNDSVSEAMKMKKGLLYILSANIISLGISLLNSFILPKFLSIESYAYIKEYALYIAYTGFFSLGYNDGMYLKYGGKNFSQIDTKDLANNFYNYTILEFIMSALILLSGVLLRNFMICAFAFGVFSNNVLGYLRSLFQSTGEFKAYGRAVNFEKIFVFLLNCALLFVFKTDEAFFYILIQVATGLVVTAILLFKLNKVKDILFSGKFSLKEYRENISTGFVLMLGNFSSILFTGIDRWFVKALMSTFYFAQYSFAVSVENIINTFLTPITISMYNYFCKRPNMEQIRKVKQYVLIWGFLIVGAAYPAKFILEQYLNKYIESSSVIFMLFAAQVFHMVIKGIYVNIYKANKRQDRYLKQMIGMLVIAVVLNASLYFVFRNMNVIAAATLLTSVIWFLLCELKDNDLKFSGPEYVYIVLTTGIYLFSGFFMGAISGFVMYYVSFGIATSVVFKQAVKDVLSEGKAFLYKRKQA